MTETQDKKKMDLIKEGAVLKTLIIMDGDNIILLKKEHPNNKLTWDIPCFISDKYNLIPSDRDSHELYEECIKYLNIEIDDIYRVKVVPHSLQVFNKEKSKNENVETSNIFYLATLKRLNYKSKKRIKSLTNVQISVTEFYNNLDDDVAKMFIVKSLLKEHLPQLNIIQ